MTNKSSKYLGIAAVTAIALAAWLGRTNAQQPAANSVSVKADEIGGVVTSTKGPEAGVWVIAETTDLPTKFRKIVVTDDAGRYLLRFQERPVSMSAWVEMFHRAGLTEIEAIPVVNEAAVVRGAKPA